MQNYVKCRVMLENQLIIDPMFLACESAVNIFIQHDNFSHKMCVKLSQEFYFHTKLDVKHVKFPREILKNPLHFQKKNVRI
jgi:hypothetical protein